MRNAIIVIGGAIAALAAVAVVAGPELRRYWKMRSM